MDILISISIGYLAGSIPFGLLLTRTFGKVDIREIGSGNIGATNVLRTGNKGMAALTLLLDAAKAGLTGWLVQHFMGAPLGFFASGAALMGHCYPVWLKFKGGKGVATLIVAAVVWLGTAIITRYSSLGALLACVIASIAAWILLAAPAAMMTSFMAIMILWRHRENIGRLIRGEESRIGQKG